MLLFRIVFVCAAVAIKTSGSDAAVGRPVLGWVWDAHSGELFPVAGLPGAAVAEAPAGTFRAADTAGDTALALGADGAVLFRGEAGRPLQAIGAGVTRVRLSPSGTAAALFDETSGRVRIVTGLAAEPSVQWEIPLGGFRAPAAVDDRGEWLIAAGPDGVPAAYGRHGEAIRLQEAGNARSVEFAPDSREAVIVQQDGRAVWLFRNGTMIREFASLPDGAEALAAAVSADGRHLVTVTAGGVSVRDRETGAVQTLVCRCTPSGLSRLHGNGVFRIAASSEVIWIADAGPAQPRLAFARKGAAR